MHESLTMLPEVQARRQLADVPLTLRMLLPPFPALGVGTLRVLRVRDHGTARVEMTVGYDTYERLG